MGVFGHVLLTVWFGWVGSYMGERFGVVNASSFMGEKDTKLARACMGVAWLCRVRRCVGVH